MIIRNTVILVDQIEHDVAAGSTRRQAIIESTVRRARPVVLTALAAILAMIPLSRSGFWGSMAVAIMGGLLVATVLTILFLPALYALWFRRSLDASATGTSHEDLRSDQLRTPSTASFGTPQASSATARPQPSDDRQLAEQELC
jgi:predicted RND superfamily exporter protein